MCQIYYYQMYFPGSFGAKYHKQSHDTYLSFWTTKRFFKFLKIRHVIYSPFIYKA
uniref:Uncharacterized protein n=1 Tax=Lepeophtheirus salmonis TaxID=72036 RepID=A0A0K2TB01_LEPSM